ncbi:hypothetical protein ACFX2I_005019 [Malus domestica]
MGREICRQRSKEAEKMVLRASRPASRLTAVVEVLCYHGGHSDELDGDQALWWKMGREGGEKKNEEGLHVLLKLMGRRRCLAKEAGEEASPFPPLSTATEHSH